MHRFGFLFLSWIAALAISGQAEPGRIQEVRRKAQSLLCQRSVLEAMTLLRGALEEGQDAPEIHYLLGRALLQESPEKNPIKALRELNIAAAGGISSAKLWQARAEWERGLVWPRSAREIRRETTENAREYLDEYLASGPKEGDPLLAEAELLAAQILLESENWQECLQHVQRAVTIAQETQRHPPTEQNALDHQRMPEVTAESARLAVEALIRQGRIADALKQGTLLVQSQPESIEVRDLYARTLDGNGKHEEAQAQRRAARLLIEIKMIESNDQIAAEDVAKLFEELTGIPPVSPRNALRIAKVNLLRKNAERVIEMCREFRKQVSSEAPDRLLAESWYLEGKAQALKGNALESESCFENAATLAPAFRSALERLLELR